jgi:hypothetical protein
MVGPWMAMKPIALPQGFALVKTSLQLFENFYQISTTLNKFAILFFEEKIIP